MAKSKQTKAHEISLETKKAVWERQNGKSIFAPYRTITVEMCCCHYVSRANGGVGQEWNIFGCYQTAWLDEHKAFDGQLSDKEIKQITNLDREQMKIVVGNHLKKSYSGWSLDKCKYHKHWDWNDYEVKRNH